jgi:hypothetical protein
MNESRVLRRIYRPQKAEVTGWKKMTYWMSESTTPLILDIGTRWR